MDGTLNWLREYLPSLFETLSDSTGNVEFQNLADVIRLNQDHCFSDFVLWANQNISRNSLELSWRLLQSHENSVVRVVSAIYGPNYLRMQLLEDKDDFVRSALAAFGPYEARQQLLIDSSDRVRETIAKYGEPELKEKLENDSDLYVRENAKVNRGVRVDPLYEFNRHRRNILDLLRSGTIIYRSFDLVA